MITEDTLPVDEMRRMEREGYRCGECNGPLQVAWGGAFGFNGFILRCADIDHQNITRHDREWETMKSIERKERHMDSTALTTMDESQMLARIDQAKFPQQLSKEDRNLLATAAISYGFDPIMNEISIFQGRPYVSIDGRYRKAQETGQLDGVETRPATAEEKNAWQIPDDDYFFRAEVYVKGASRPFVGWGRVRSGESQKGKGFKPVETNPQRMAEKRAEAQALRKAFHIPLPSLEDIGEPNEGDQPRPARKIIDVQVEDPPVEEPLEEEVDEQPAPSQMTGPFNPDDLATWTDLFREIAKVYPDLNSSSKVCAELNVKNQSELAAQYKIAAVAARQIIANRS